MEQNQETLQILTQDSNAWVTTLLDLHGLPTDFPGLQNNLKKSDAYQKVDAIEKEFKQEVNNNRFIPFVVLHELETWIFSSPSIFAEHFHHIDLAQKMNKILKHFSNKPELINHNKETHPKAQLFQMITRYKATSDGVILLKKIGIPTIRQYCPHFNDWLTKLESLSDIVPKTAG